MSVARKGDAGQLRSRKIWAAPRRVQAASRLLEQFCHRSGARETDVESSMYCLAAGVVVQPGRFEND